MASAQGTTIRIAEPVKPVDAATTDEKTPAVVHDAVSLSECDANRHDLEHGSRKQVCIVSMTSM